ncbi:MAG: nucleotidyltransferase domain-containing protein [Nitrososphaerota archaeon]|nr:nucleotidyltransferase domain-containing protein [Candidatus Calditenuaceae archaeon]MDW8073612.1 nucleotidyltransferase domain-containing protein [Nitrososphaerota archaeon]
MSPRNIPSDVLEAVEALVRALSSRVRVERVLIFGSYARGNWLKTSDLDLIIVSKDFEGMRFGERLDLIGRVCWELGLRPSIEALAYTPEELERKVIESAVVGDASRYWIELSFTGEARGVEAKRPETVGSE